MIKNIFQLNINDVIYINNTVYAIKDINYNTEIIFKRSHFLSIKCLFPKIKKGIEKANIYFFSFFS